MTTGAFCVPPLSDEDKIELKKKELYKNVCDLLEMFNPAESCELLNCEVF